MKKIISLFLVLGLLAGMTLVFSSCGSETEPISGGAQISVYLGSEIYDFDPQGNQTDDAALSVLRLLFEPLFTIDDDGDLLLAGAKSYKINKSEHKVTITLHESYWSDGTTLVRASDYVYSWKRLIRAGVDNPASTLFLDVKGAKEVKEGTAKLDTFGVVALSNDTLEITFEDGFTAYDAFLRNLAHVATAPLNEKAVSGRDSFWAKRTVTFSSNGPFKIVTLDHTAGTFRLERNKGYHRPNGSTAVADAFVIPAALKAVWNVNPDVSDEEYVTALIDQLAEKTVFYIGEVPPEKREELRNSAVISDTLSTYSYLFNCANPLFADPAVRSILASVIDRNTILTFTVYGKAATGLIPGTVNDGSKASSSWKTGAGALPATAAKSVSEAKAALDAIEGYEPGAFTLTYLDTEVNGKIAAYVKGLWDELGYTVTLDPVIADTRHVEDGGTITVYDSVLQTKYANRTYDVLGIDYQMYSTNALPVFATLTDSMSGSGINFGDSEGVVEGATLDELINNTEEVQYVERTNRLNYSSEAYDAKVEAAYAEKDLSKRSTLLHEAEEILLSEMPLIPLVFNQRAYMASGDLSGLDVDRFGFVSFTLCKQKNYELYLAVDDDAVATTAETTAEPEETEGGEEEAGE